MGLAKRVSIEFDDGNRVDSWSEPPLAYEVTIQGEFDGNRATSWIDTVIGEDEVELHCVDENVDGVIYKGVYPSVDAAEAAIKELVDRAGAHHFVMHNFSPS